MATRIRLARGGKKKRPYYRIVVADSRAPRDGKFIERIGSYDPLLAENKATFNVERATYWLDVGARPSERVSKLLTLQGVEHKLVVVPTPAPAVPEAPVAKPKRKAAKAGATPAEPAKEAEEKPAAKAGATPAEPAKEAEEKPAAKPKAADAEAGGDEPAAS